MPERFLLQILRVLVTHGILRSTRGVDGGYALTKPADQISLLEVIEAIDGPLDSESQNWVTDSFPVRGCQAAFGPERGHLPSPASTGIDQAVAIAAATGRSGSGFPAARSSAGRPP
jgi:hypothetical protein